MQKRIEYNGVIHEFPDDFSDKDIQFALTQKEAPEAPKAQTAQLGNDPLSGIQHYSGMAKSVGQTLFGGALAVPQLIESYGGPREPDLLRRVREGLQTKPHEQRGATVGRMIQSAIPAMATGGASLPIQAGAGGLGAAAIASGAGDDPKTAGAIGAAGPVAGSLLQRVVPMLRKGAQERVASAIDPRGMEEKKSLAQVLPEVTARKPFAWSSEGLQGKFEQSATRIAEQLDAAIDNSKVGALDTRAVAGSMDDLVQSISRSGGSVTPEAQAAIGQLQQVQREIVALGDDTFGAATIPRIRELKQQYDKIVAGATKHFFRDQAAAGRGAAAKEGYHALRTAMVDAVPDSGTLGKEYQRVATVRNILSKNEIRNISGSAPGVGRIAEIGAVAGSMATGNPQLLAVAGTIAALRKIVDSTPLKLVSANLRTSIANALDSGDVTVASQLVAQAIRESQRAMMVPQ